MKTWMPLLLISSLTVTLIGCGDNGNGGSTPKPPVTPQCPIGQLYNATQGICVNNDVNVIDNTPKYYAGIGSLNGTNREQQLEFIHGITGCRRPNLNPFSDNPYDDRQCDPYRNGELAVAVYAQSPSATQANLTFIVSAARNMAQNYFFTFNYYFNFGGYDYTNIGSGAPKMKSALVSIRPFSDNTGFSLETTFSGERRQPMQLRVTNGKFYDRNFTGTVYLGGAVIASDVAFEGVLLN